MFEKQKSPWKKKSRPVVSLCFNLDFAHRSNLYAAHVILHLTEVSGQHMIEVVNQ
jgi:hypothetical protein